METSRLARRALAVAVALGLVVGGALSLPSGASVFGSGRPGATVALPSKRSGAVGVAGQNAMDHHAHAAAMHRVAVANGLQRASGRGRCGTWYQFRTATGLHCAKAPMLRSMFTADQLAASPAQTAAADPKVTCFGTGTDGKRIELVYARRSNKADQSVTVDPQLRQWASSIEQTMVMSAQKTGGIRKVRWVHDSTCTPTVRNVVVGTSVTSFSQLVAALEGAGLTSASRKYLVAWDDGDATSAFCGLGEVFSDSTAGSGNLNETQFGTSMFAAVENPCWSASVSAHEVMHTLGAVQDDAPHASGNGHCTDESDIMCYVDGPGVVMSQVCPAAQEDLYDCNSDDYFSTNPPAASYLKTHWNPANSGWLDASGSSGPPSAPRDVVLTPGAGQVSLSWSPPAYDGSATLLGYVIALEPSGRVVTVAASATSATITGLADGTPVTVSLSAANRLGTGGAELAGPTTPAPLVETLATTPDGEIYPDLARGPSGSVYLAASGHIDRVAADGTVTTVVGGTATFPVVENTLPLQTYVLPRALAVAPNGDLYWYDDNNGKIRRLSGGRVNSVAGNGSTGATGDGGAALAAAISPTNLAIDPIDSSVYFVDSQDGVVRRFTVGGNIVKVAGTAGASGFAGDGGAAASATFDTPRDLAIDNAHRVFVADTYNHRVRAFTMALGAAPVGGTISTVAGDGTTPIYPGATLPATGTAVSYPDAIDWSADKGLLIDTFGLERVLVGANLVRLAGDLFDESASDADGTPATAIYYGKQDTIRAVTWSGSTLHVLTWGPLPDGTGQQGKLRSAGPWSAAQPAAAPGAPVAAPVAAAGQVSATVSWVPVSNGGSAISSYKVTASPGGAVTTAAASATSVKVTGLAAGTSYTFTVAAVNAVGTGGSSSPSNAVVPTAAPSYLPFASWAALVARQHQDVLGRAPTASESSTWVTALTAGTKLPRNLVDELRRSAENTTNVDPTARLYRAFLGRAPDAGGLEFWIGRRRSGNWSLTKMADSFASSNEFKTKYGSLTDRQFVTRIYTDVLGRTADQTGVDYWTKKLDTKTKTRGGVMIGFSESSEYKRKQAENTDVSVAYIFLLGRVPTAAESSDWVTRQKAGTTHPTLLGEVLATPGYASHIAG